MLETPLTAQQKWSHDVRLDAEPRSAARARAFVRHHLTESQLPYLVDSVLLVACELITNGIVHAKTPLTLTLSRTDTVVRLSVHDESSKVPVPRPFAQAAEGGYGLGIVGRLSLRWGVDTGPGPAKTVWATFDTRSGVDA
jgi:anti-sigma regulatory factor (Ser/Thr protein kinase)